MTTQPTTPFVLLRRVSIAGCLAGASVLVLGGSAFAQTATTTTTKPASAKTRPSGDARTGHRSPLTAAQQACLTAKGFGPKAKPAAGTAATTKTQKTEAERTAEKAAREAAATACGVTLPAGGRGGHRGHGPGDRGSGHGSGNRGATRGPSSGSATKAPATTVTTTKA